ncbi:MAG: CoA pyrophosphatase [Methyloligellaceae bacterium]
MTFDEKKADIQSELEILNYINDRLEQDIPETLFDPGIAALNGDHVLNMDVEGTTGLAEKIRPAAVLVPIVKYTDRLSLILTTRSAHLSSHAGQVAFPGGKVDEEDVTIIDTALRETEEEVGIHRKNIEILGYLDSYQTATGFRILPIVGIIEEGYSYNIDRNEVEDLFEVPLKFLMSPENHKKESLFWRNKDRHFYSMPYEDRNIWGATAGIIRNLYERLYC